MSSNLIHFLLLLSLVNLTRGTILAQEERIIALDERLELTEINPYLYVHTSYLEGKDGQLIGCNGLIYIYAGEVMVFDAPVNNRLSILLINYLEGRGFKIKGIIINHFHEDCLGGLEAFHNKGVQSYAEHKTINKAREHKVTEPTNGFNVALNMVLARSKVITNRYCGPAHTFDNIVSYIPEYGVLFGGCMVKAVDSSKGNLADAYEDDWAHTLERVDRAFPNVKIVVPGHGAYGGKELLDYSMQLFALPEGP